MLKLGRFLSRFAKTSSIRRRRYQRSAGVESLEIRQLPATLVNPTTLTYQDYDGDNVTVKFSQPLLTAANVNTIFKFNSGAGAVNGNNNTPEILTQLFIANLPSVSMTNITTTATRNATRGGDGFATLGEIEATSQALGTVFVDGDLGRIVAASAKGLTVQSLFRFGIATGANSYGSYFSGNLSALTVKGDVAGGAVKLDGELGPVTINGSLIGGFGPNSGSIAAMKLGTVTINGDIVGGSNVQSGGLASATTIGAVTVKGSIRGGTATKSGSIVAQTGTGAVSVLGGLFGGTGDQSGAILGGTGKLASVTIGGSVLGSTGLGSGGIAVSSGEIGNVVIAGDLAGSSAASAEQNGAIFLSNSGKLGNVTIGGSVIGGAARHSGFIFAGPTGLITIKGNMVGGGGERAGSTFTTISLAGATVNGSLLGGMGAGSAAIVATRIDGAVNIGGDLRGGGDASTAILTTMGGIKSITIGGSIMGGSQGSFTAGIHVTGDIGSLTINGSVMGGSGDGSGKVRANGKITNLKIGGSLVGGSGSDSGSVSATKEITTANILGDLIGGSASGSTTLHDSGVLFAERINSLTLGGSLIAGTDNTTGQFSDNGFIRVSKDLGTVLIKGNVVGNSLNRARISASGKSGLAAGAADVAVGSLTVNGRVEYAEILAGADTSIPLNADAQITTVKVLGDWIASSLIAGVSRGLLTDFFGDFDDVVINGKDDPVSKSKIGSITIGGQVLGTLGGTDSFAFEARQIGSLKIGDATQTATAALDDYFIGITFDFRVREFA